MITPDRASIGWALDAAQTRRLQQAAAARGVPLADLLHDLQRKVLAEQGLDGAFQFGHAAAPDPMEPLETRIHALWQALLPGAEWGADEGFFDVGGNSLLVIRLFEKLESSWPGLFTVAQLFAVNTIKGQARWIRERQGEPLPAPPAAAGTGALAPVAIVGFALRLPGAGTLDACWRDVAAGADRVGPLPERRAAEARAMLALMGMPAAEPFGEAGWLDEAFAFDPGRFRLAPADAALVEPEHRLFLETALMALEDAGYGGRALDGARVGTFVGMSSGAVWRELAGRLAPERAEQAFALNVPSNVATRLSFLHDWRGPAGLVDTACSSALSAVHQACRALASGDCSAALAGGAKLILLPPTAHARFAIESSTARTHAFDASADGTGAGEGAVVFLLKTLERAQADGDAIHAVILGTALNQDGASSGMAAPNPAAQAEVIAAAALAAGVPLATLSYIEAHGTGTHLGDPIEIEGLTRAFGAGRGSAAIGSGKGNYGHLDACAGALGLARAVLCLAHDQAPPQPFFTEPNPRIDFAAAPVQVCRELAALADLGTPRRAGVSSFGLSGINVHVVLEAPPARPARAPGSGWTVVGVSAATPALLMDYVADLAAALRARPGCALGDLALTLNTGRDALAERLAVWARDPEELLAAWDAVLAGQDAAASLARSLSGSVPRGRRLQATAPVSALAAGETDAMAAARAFIEGAALAWPPERPAGRVHLPPSPLQRITCRPELNAATLPATAGPLRLGPPCDTPDGVRRSVDVHSPAFWPVAEHRLGGVPTLVGMGLLPLLAEAWAGGPDFQPFAVRDLAWLRPLQAPALKPGCVSLLVAPSGQRCLLGGRGLDGAWRQFAEATLAAAPAPPASLDLGELQREVGELVPAGPFSADPDGFLQVSARWDCLRAAAGRGDSFLARLERPRDPESAGWHGLHPGLLDCAASLVLDRPGLVPAGCREILVCAPLPERVLAHAVRRALPDGGVEADVRLCAPDTGVVCLALLGLRFALLAQRQEAAGAVEKVPVVLSLPAWTPEPLGQGDAGAGPFLLVGEGALCARILAEAGARVQAVTGSFALSAEVLAAVAAGRAGQILLAPGPGPDLVARVAEALRRLMGAMRQPLRLLAVGQGDWPETASMAALVQVAAREEALLSTQHLEVQERTPVAAVLREFSGFERRCGELALLDEHGERRVRTFIPLAGNASGPAMVWPDSGCCVVTGGTGGLTLMLAEELARSGRVALALISRHGRPTGGDPESLQRREALDSLEGRGIRVRHWLADVSDREQLAGVLDQVRRELGPITAVLHNAGVPDSGVLVKEDSASFARATAGKVDGARHLDALTREDPVQAFVLSGSLSGIEAMAGFGAYTAANAFLDGFAGWRRREGRPALAIDWCQIGGMGMAARRQAEATEALSLTPQDVVRTWRLALASGAARVVLLYHGRPGAEFQAAPAAPAKAAGSQVLEQALAGIWARVLGYPQVEYDDDFYALGGDSISGVEIVQAIVEDLGHPATLTDLLEGGTVNGLAGRLRGRAPAAGVSAALVPAPALARYPLGWEQLAVVRAQSEAVASTAFNLPYFLELPPDCDPARLEAALGLLVERHEILRTRFHLDGVEPEMEILAPLLRLARIHPPGGFTEDFRRQWVRPFDLEAGPPVRFELAVRADGTPEALLFDLHHSLADGLSIERLVTELAALYAGSSLPPQPLQFKDYAWWSRKGAGAEAMDQAKAYWLERYVLPLPVMELPADRPRPVIHDGHCGLAAFALPKATVAALRRFAATRRTTPFSVVLAAWAALLARYARTGDLVIAVPIDARDRVGLPGLPGMMVAVLPLRFRCDPDEAVGGFLDRVQAEVKEAMGHRACPLGTLLEALAPPAAPERALLSEVRLSYMNYAGAGTVETEEENGFRLAGINRSDTKSDLSIFIRDLPGEITVVVEYYAALFDPERIERMGGHFATLLAAMVEAAPDAPLARLALLPDTERAWLEAAGHGGTRPLPDHASLFGLFTAQVAARGAAPAVSDDAGSLSYDELWHRAGGIARALIAAGVRPGDRVAQHVERSCAAVATMLGIHAAGAAYLPLDPAWPPQRVAWMLQDAGCRVVVADASGRRALAEGQLAATVLAVEDLGPGCAPPALDRAPDALAYLMYTSGSTGEPKGVRVLDRGILRLVVQEDYAGLGPDDRLLQAAPLAFDAATFEIWGALLNGAQLWVAGRDAVLDPAALAALLERRRISVLWLTTGLFNRQVEAFPACFQGIRIVLTGGETASPRHLRQAMAACPATEFRNCYGPTENTTFTTTHRVTPADLDAVPIGRPVPHTTVQVLDRAGQLVPMGVWGEIVTGGDGVADGYWNRPELTAAGFLAGPGGVSYRTGDLGRWRADGALEFGGRMDGQIKLRGFRIELGEIESALARHPAVTGAAVLFRREAGELIACVTVGKAEPQAAELRAWLLGSLPPIMVPSRFIRVGRLPITANGKLDRARLDLEAADGQPLAEAVAAGPPETEAERLVAGVFAELFGDPVLDRGTSFLDLGGHSLIIIRAINRIDQLCGQRLTVGDFFTDPSIKGLAARIQGRRREAAGAGIPRATGAASLLASHAEERLFLAHGLDPTGSAYNLTFAFVAGRELVPGALRRALSALMVRHESLRTGFEARDGQLFRRIEPAGGVPLAWAEDDLSGLADPQAEALRLVRWEVAQPFDLGRPPLLRARLLKLGADTTLILIVTHHIVHDGWSSRVFTRELGLAYRAATRGRDPELPALPIRYGDYAAWQRGQDWSEDAAWWARTLEHAPDLIALPGDRPPPEVPSNRGETIRKQLPPAVAEGLRDLARQRGVSMAALGLALFSALLFRLTRQADMVIGMGVAGRDQAELEGLIGFFVNVLPIRVRLSETAEFEAILAQVHASLMGALERRHYPFDRLVRDLAPRRSGNLQPLVNVVFEYHRFDSAPSAAPFPAPARDPGEAFGRALDECLHPPTAKHDLLVFYEDREDRADLVLEYNTDLLSAATAERWLSYLTQFAASVGTALV